MMAGAGARIQAVRRTRWELAGRRPPRSRSAGATAFVGPIRCQANSLSTAPTRIMRQRFFRDLPLFLIFCFANLALR